MTQQETIARDARAAMKVCADIASNPHNPLSVRVRALDVFNVAKARLDSPRPRSQKA